jgi:hypothetical protein
VNYSICVTRIKCVFWGSEKGENKGISEKGKVKKTSGSLPTACRDSGEWRREKGFGFKGSSFA